MDIKDFIKETMVQIVEGVEGINEALETKGAYIASKQVVGEGVNVKVEKDKTTRNLVKVEFDLAVTVTNIEDNKIGTGLSIASLFSLGATSEGKNTNQEVSRIKFALPLALPDDKIEKPSNQRKRTIRYGTI